MSTFPCVYTKWQYVYTILRSLLPHNLLQEINTSIPTRALSFILTGPSIVGFTVFAAQITAAMVDSYNSIHCELCAWK